MLLNIYLGTIVFTWITVAVFCQACVNRIKRRGYKFVESKLTFSEKVISFLSSVLPMIIPLSIPIFNTGIAITLICDNEKLYEDLENTLLKKGKIYKTTEEQAELKTSLLKDTNNIFEKKTKKEKTYNEMTKEEKIDFLEREKEKILAEATNKNTDTFTLQKKL